MNHVQMDNTIAIHFQNMLRENPMNSSELYTVMVCGKIEEKSLSGCEYFVIFIDDKSRYVCLNIHARTQRSVSKIIE